MRWWRWWRWWRRKRQAVGEVGEEAVPLGALAGQLRADPQVEGIALRVRAGPLIAFVADPHAVFVLQAEREPEFVRGRKAGGPAVRSARHLRMRLVQRGRKAVAVHFVQFVENGVRVVGIDPRQGGAEVGFLAAPERLERQVEGALAFAFGLPGRGGWRGGDLGRAAIEALQQRQSKAGVDEPFLAHQLAILVEALHRAGEGVAEQLVGQAVAGAVEQRFLPGEVEQGVAPPRLIKAAAGHADVGAGLLHHAALGQGGAKGGHAPGSPAVVAGGTSFRRGEAVGEGCGWFVE